MVDVKFSLESPNGQIFSEKLTFWVDSGFDGFLKLPETYAPGFSSLGISGVDSSIEVASGSALALLYLGKIDEIYVGDTLIDLNSSIDCDILCLGNENNPPLIGLSALSKWNICLDLPKEILNFS